ncbi:hypothetical protein BA011_31985 (plasmid) [Rhizobium leguminosarum]|uniref:Uncharacterized protein n=1 Tax=Rhizobium leguminosarum TaxID=384 RepID=A0A179C243_RHILE|nr:hypothetical protein BA011_30100 [Rhizobium leguminosarum]ANP90545.1 hypothetical protein BA011_31985 [Rhizobium leguminosarum]OAP97635.1 hypothetical protein A4U53_36380 [Rhizobium leguminosarum]
MPFGMPLNAYLEGRRILDPYSLDKSVIGDAFDNQIVAEPIYTLPMERIDPDLRPIRQSVKHTISPQVQAMNRVVLTVPFQT